MFGADPAGRIGGKTGGRKRERGREGGKPKTAHGLKEAEIPTTAEREFLRQTKETVKYQRMGNTLGARTITFKKPTVVQKVPFSLLRSSQAVHPSCSCCRRTVPASE